MNIVYFPHTEPWIQMDHAPAANRRKNKHYIYNVVRRQWVVCKKGKATGAHDLVREHWRWHQIEASVVPVQHRTVVLLLNL